MFSRCNLFKKLRHVHKTSAPDRPWHCKTLAGAKPLTIATIATIGDNELNHDVVHIVPPGPQAQQEICSSMHETLRREESLGSHRGLMEAMPGIWAQLQHEKSWDFTSGTIHQPNSRQLSKHFTIHNNSQNSCNIACPTHHLSLHISWDRSSGLEGCIFKTANTLTCLSNFIQRNLPKRNKNVKSLIISPSNHNSPPVTGIFRISCGVCVFPFMCHWRACGIYLRNTKDQRVLSQSMNSLFLFQLCAPADLNIPKTFINTSNIW